MTVHFTKMSGAGNDFIMIDNRAQRLALSQEVIAKWCQRGTGIGADGLILLEESDRCDFAMRYYNADGKLGSMCGNGGRCVTRFAQHRGIEKTQFAFEANGELYRSEILSDGRVKLRMNPPKAFRDKFLVEGYEAYFIDTGSPHVIIYAPDVETLDVFGEGKKVRSNPAFFPNGANVNFLRVVAPDSIRIRTFERGVENETLACGTGCVAAALVSHRLGKLRSRLANLLVQSGETIQVEFDEAFENVFLIGSAEIVFEGYIQLSPRRSLSTI
ncbi:MAG: diaminopimelate epimerase [Chloroherpetonaceae bacterium]|nr:diaminopimelate epimerase [Chloroherpetonaceae bacterium]MDW8437519.1 diaminopimelate epimerase [Chloroherpetonaceae bacterium]